MGWLIECNDPECGQKSWAENIVTLIAEHRDADGWFVCACGRHEHIKKNFSLQEAGEWWRPYLRGIVPLGVPGDTYQPFVFLISGEPPDPVRDVWFSYYKDLRSTGGVLKLGYGPGGPPVLGMSDLVSLLSRLVQLDCLTTTDVLAASNSSSQS